MDIRQLKYFVGVVEAGSFTKAAADLHVAQSALSLHVRQMEEGFGINLLIRERTGVRPTEKGLKLLAHARAILHHVALAETELTSRKGSPAGDVTIGIPSGAARVMVSELLATSQRLLPKVSLKITEGMTGAIEEMMAAGRLNLAVLYRNEENVGSNVELAREEFCFVTPPSYASSQTQINLNELQKFPLAVPMPTNNARQSVAEAVARHGLTLDIRFEVDSLATIIKMVSEGKAYSILTPSAIQSEVRAGLVKTLKIVNPTITRSVVLVTNARDEKVLAVTATRKVLIDSVRWQVENGDWPATLPA